jgi:hypothetical protein
MVRTLLASSAGVDKFVDALALSSKAFGENTALAEEAATAYASFWSQVTLLKNQAKDLLEKVFMVMRPTLIAIIDGLKKLIKGLGTLSPAVIKMLVVGAAILASIGPVLIVLGGLLSTLLAGLGSLGVIFLALQSPLAIIIAGLAALGVGLTTSLGLIQPLAAGGEVALHKLARAWDALVEHITPAIEGIKDALAVDDMRLAVDIGLTQIKLSFAIATRDITKWWIETSAKIQTSWANTVAAVETGIQNIKTARQRLPIEAGMATGLIPQQRGEELLADINAPLRAIENTRLQAIKKIEVEAVANVGKSANNIIRLTNKRNQLVAFAAAKVFIKKTQDFLASQPFIQVVTRALFRGGDAISGSAGPSNRAGLSGLADLSGLGGRLPGHISSFRPGPVQNIQGAQIGTAEAASRIAAFRSGAGMQSDSKATADNTSRIVTILEEIRDAEPLTVKELGFGSSSRA